MKLEKVAEALNPDPRVTVAKRVTEATGVKRVKRAKLELVSVPVLRRVIHR
jgi:hypothetical protein